MWAHSLSLSHWGNAPIWYRVFLNNAFLSSEINLLFSFFNKTMNQTWGSKYLLSRANFLSGFCFLRLWSTKDDLQFFATYFFERLRLPLEFGLLWWLVWTNRMGCWLYRIEAGSPLRPRLQWSEVSTLTPPGMFLLETQPLCCEEVQVAHSESHVKDNRGSAWSSRL